MLPPFFPHLATRSGQVYPQNYMAEQAEDCLCQLQTIPEEQHRGTQDFPIVVEDPEAEDNVFTRYYHNEGQD